MAASPRNPWWAWAWAIYDHNGQQILSSHCTLPLYATVFQAEVSAIMLACSIIKCFILSDIRFTKVIIYSDSQAALRSLTAMNFKSKVTLECAKTLNRLAATFNARITLRWIKAHVGYEGNELADELAKKGSMNQGDLELNPPIPHSYTKSQNRKYITQLWNTMWRLLPTCRQTKIWFPEVNWEPLKHS